jgi:hypothetical protein
MVKTSFRLSEETVQALAQIADQCHNGNRTAALAEAIQRYQQSLFAQPVGWVQLRVQGKVRCTKCNNAIDGQAPAFARLEPDGRVSSALLCGKCTR